MKKTFKSMLSFLIIVSMCLSLCMPMTAWAETTDETTIENEVIEAENLEETTGLSTTTAPEGYIPQNSYIGKDEGVKLFSEDETPRVLLVEDVLPWKSNANQVVLNQLTEYDKVTTSQFLTIDLSKYGVIVFANDQPFSTYENYKAFKEYMELFASIGGVIVFGACDAGWSNGELIEKLPGNVGKTTHYVKDNYIVDTTHPIVSGALIDNVVLTDKELTSSYCSHVSFDENTLPAGSKIILREKDTNRPTLVEYPLGKGRVISSGLTWEHNYVYGGQSLSYGIAGYFAKIAMADMFKYAIRVSSIDVDDVHILKEYYMNKNAHYVVVADKNSTAIKGATVTIDGENHTTDENGMVPYSGNYGIKEIKVSADGYRDSNQYYNLQPRQSRNVFLETAKNDGKPYVTMVADTTTFFDLRHQTKRYEEGTGAVLSLRVRANWAGASNGKYIIYQEGVAGGAAGKSITSNDGNFSFAPGKVLNPEQQVKLKLVSNNGTESEPINLNIIIDKAINYGESENGGKGLENITGIKLAEDKTGTVNDSNATAIFPGDFSLKISSFPITIAKSVNDDGSITYKGAIGIASGKYNKDIRKWEKEEWAQFRNDIDNAATNVWRKNELTRLMDHFGAKAGGFTIQKKLINPKIEGLGYIEIKTDKNGNIIESDGGVIVTGGNTSTYSQQFMAGPVPIYLDLSGKVEIELKFGLGYDFKNDKWLYDGELTLGPSISLGGGLGISGVATVGVEGSAGLGIKLHPQNQGDVTLDAKIKAYLLWVFDWEYSIAKKKFELWGYNEKAALMSLDDMGVAGGDISISSREYNKKTSSWQGQSISLMDLDDNPESFLTLQEYIMPNTLPELVKIDDTYILLFHADDSKKTTGNNVVLMYSVYDNNTDSWLEPKVVSEGNSSDLYAKSFVYNNELYVIWQKIKTEVVSTEANELLDEMSANIDISFAKWNKTTNSFDQIYVNNDNKLDIYPNLAIDGEKITAVWVSNSANNVKGETGTYTVMTSDLLNGVWSKPVTIFETNNYITEVSAGYVDGNLEILYAVNGENALGNIYKIYNNESEIVAGQTAVGSSLVFNDGYFYWTENGAILQYDANKNTIATIRSGNEGVIMSSYKIVKNETDTAVVWIANSEEGGSEVYASIKNGDNWSNPIVLLENQGYSIQYMDVEFDNDGTWKLVLNTKETIDGEERSSIVYVDADVRSDTTLNYVDIDEKDRVDGTQPVKLNVSNNGQNIVNELLVKIKDSEGNIYFDKTVECSILPGENKTTTVEIDLPALTSNTKLEILAYVENEFDIDDNTIIETVGRVDVSLQLSQYTIEDNLILSATVTNNSDIPANTAISIVEDSKDGIVLDMKNIGILTNESSYVYLYSIDKNAINYNGEDHKYYYITLNTLEEDINEYDNTEIVTVYPMSVDEPNDAPIEEVEIIDVTGVTTPETLEIALSDEIVTKQLTAVVMPENATNKDVEWTSDNKDVAIVNQNGVVTALSAGTANITATTLDGNYSSTTIVNVTAENETTYTLTLGAVSNGAVSNGSISASATNCVEGQTILLLAQPDDGYKFKSWNSSNGGTFADANASSTTFTMPANDTTITATFEKESSAPTGGGGGGGTPSYKITVTQGKNGTISPSSTSVSKNGNKTFTIAPDEGYEIEDVIVDGESVGAVTTYTFEKITKAATITAKFKKIEETKAVWENPFDDVNENDWFYEAVRFASEKGITSGVSENKFAPNGKVTRGQFITMLCRAYGIEEMTGDNFEDCGNTWYTGYLAAAKQLGISNGVGDNKFAPEKEISREEMVTLIYNYLKSINEVDIGKKGTSFKDNDSISDWAKAGVAFASENGYVNGKGNNRFDPNGDATRAELAQIFFNMFK